MENRTTNIGLIKPIGKDNFDIRHFNENAEILDKEIEELKESIDAFGGETPVNWEDIEGKPESFTPSEHSHTGYALSSHSHTGYALSSHSHTANAIMYKGSILGDNTSDVDTIKTVGIYNVILTTAAATPLNFPEVGDTICFGVLEVKGQSNYFVQNFYCANTGEIFTRIYYNSKGWSKWTKLVTVVWE